MLACAVATGVEKLGELAVRDGRTIDAEARDLHLVRLELVVVRPRLVHRAERERASRHVDLGRSARCAIGRRRLDDRILGAGAGLQRLEHRLLRLELVLENEAEDEPATDEDVGSLEIDALEHVERPLAHVRGIRTHCRRIEGRELRAVRPLAAERVVDVVVGVGDRARPSDGAKDPELLEAGDVRVAPRERRDAG